MPIRRNGYYSDPYIAKGFDNLAKMFAPPSGSDLYGYTHAASERAKAARLAELYAVATNPASSRDTIDRTAIGAGAYAPTSSYYSVDRANDTSLQNNRATNATTIEKTNLDNKAALERQFALPISAGKNEIVRLPDQTAAATGLPAMFSGQVALSPGDKAIMPDGQTLQGNPKPLTETEAKAAELKHLRDTGQIDDSTMKAIIFGSTPIEQVSTPQGPRNVLRTDAVGQAPAVDTKTKPTLANYKKPGGDVGTARFDAAQGWVDSQTNEKLPQGTQTYSANLQGDKNSTGLGGPTTANNTSANNRAAEVSRTLDILDLYEGLIRNNPGVVGLPGLLRGTSQNAIATMKDMANAFGKTVPQIEQATSELQQGLKGVAPELFDPAIPEAQFYQGTLAYALARTENPSGEVSRQAYSNALSRISGGALANPERIMAEVNAFRKTLKTEIDAIRTLRDPKTGRTDTNYQGTAPATAAPAGPVERWMRGPDGKLMRAQ